MELHLKKNISPNNGIVLTDVFRPKLLNFHLLLIFNKS